MIVYILSHCSQARLVSREDTDLDLFSMTSGSALSVKTEKKIQAHRHSAGCSSKLWFPSELISKSQMNWWKLMPASILLQIRGRMPATRTAQNYPFEFFPSLNVFFWYKQNQIISKINSISFYFNSILWLSDLLLYPPMDHIEFFDHLVLKEFV